MPSQGLQHIIRSSFLTSLQTEILFDRVYGGNTLVSNASLSHGRVATPLTNNIEIYNNMKDLIVNAKSEVFMMFYKMEHGSDPEKDLDEALVELSKTAQKEKKIITVRLLVNKRGHLTRLVKPIQSTNLFSNGKEYPGLDFQYAEHTHQAFGSYHSKMIVIDGNKALLNSGDLTSNGNYKASSKSPKFIELSNRLEGEVAKALRHEFAQLWNMKSVTALHSEKTFISKISPLTTSAESKLPEQDILFIAKKPNGNYFKRSFQSPHVKAVIRAIEQAKEKVNICNMAINNDAILNAIVEASLRGVKINLVLSEFGSDNSAMFNMGGSHQQALQRLFSSLTKKNFKHYENINIRWITDANGLVVKEGQQRAIHAKLLCADDIVITGSSPMDLQSAFYSQETDIVIDSSDVANEYNEKIFQPLFDKGIDIFQDPGTRITKPGLAEEILLCREVFTIVDESIKKVEAHKNKIAVTLSGSNELKIVEDSLQKMKKLKMEISLISHSQKSIKKLNISNKMQNFKEVCQAAAGELKRQEYHSSQNVFMSILYRVGSWIKNTFSKEKNSYGTLFAVNKIAVAQAKKVEIFLRTALR